VTATTPDWLTRHGAELRGNPDGRAYAVYFGDDVPYTLHIFPTGGKYGCRVKQTINGKHLEKGAAFPTPEEALRGGLEDLRQALGW
jgi:hypothetical protein